MKHKPKFKPLPPEKWKRSRRTGNPICQCGRGYGSEFDGLCYSCRGGITAWTARRYKETQQ